jgi:hypothetical protein
MLESMSNRINTPVEVRLDNLAERCHICEIFEEAVSGRSSAKHQQVDLGPKGFGSFFYQMLCLILLAHVGRHWQNIEVSILARALFFDLY